MKDSKDPYVYEGTSVLKNKLDIKDQKLLQRVETFLSIANSLELQNEPVKGKFDIDHIKKIHQKLFSDLYSWAGKIRMVDISKGNSRFASCHLIDSSFNKLAKELKNENFLKGLDKKEFSERVGHYLGEINAIHPFREGNGRTQREFINQLAKENNLEIKWKGINKEQMKKASIESFFGKNSSLTSLIYENLNEVKKEKLKTLFSKDPIEKQNQINDIVKMIEKDMPTKGKEFER